MRLEKLAPAACQLLGNDHSERRPENLESNRYFSPQEFDKLQARQRLVEWTGQQSHHAHLFRPAPPVPLDAKTVRGRWLAAVTSSLTGVNHVKRSQGRGIWYPSEYTRRFSGAQGLMDGLAPSELFTTRNDLHWRAHAESSATAALTAFMKGLTVADCGSVLQAALYEGLLEVMGSEAFDRTFGPAASPLLITRVLYEGDLGALRGNPLEPLMPAGPAQTIEESRTRDRIAEVEFGDVCHLAGVPNYVLRHPAGMAQGFNVVCVKRRADDGQPLFLGFGRALFSEPRTRRAIADALEASYREPPSEEDLHIVDRWRSSLDPNVRIRAEHFDLLSEDPSPGAGRVVCLARPDFEAIAALAGSGGRRNWSHRSPEAVPLPHRMGVDAEVSSSWAAMLAREPAPGITAALQRRFSNGEFARGDWHPSAVDASEKLDLLGALRLLEQNPGIPVEDIGASFANYRPLNRCQKELHEIAQKFARHLLDPARDEPLGLFLAGTPGAGKTHLALAIAQSAAAHGLKVGFVSEDSLRRDFDRRAREGTPAEHSAEMARFLEGHDLVIVDDANGKFSRAGDLAKAAVQAAARRRTAVVITSNGSDTLVRLADDAPTRFDRGYGFLEVRSGIEAPTGRGAWTSQREEVKTPVGVAGLEALREVGVAEGQLPGLRDLLELPAGTGAGIVLQSPDLDLETFSLRVQAASGARVAVTPPPYTMKYRPWTGSIGQIWTLLDTHLAETDVFVLPIRTGAPGRADQLTELVTHVHDAGKKLILVTDRAPMEVLRGWRESVDSSAKRARVEARLKAVFREFGAWPHL